MQSGNAPKIVLEWYRNRLKELSRDLNPLEEYIKENGLGNAIYAAVRLEEIESRPDRRTLVDLAVVREDLPRVERCLCCVTSPLADLSMVVIANNSIADYLAEPETRKWLKYVWVYAKYLKAQAGRSGTASSPVLEWFTMRINEINTTLMQIRRKETLILEQAPSVEFFQ